MLQFLDFQFNLISDWFISFYTESVVQVKKLISDKIKST